MEERVACPSEQPREVGRLRAADRHRTRDARERALQALRHGLQLAALFEPAFLLDQPELINNPNCYVDTEYLMADGGRVIYDDYGAVQANPSGAITHLLPIQYGLEQDDISVRDGYVYYVLTTDIYRIALD